MKDYMNSKQPDGNFTPADRWNEHLPPVCSYLELLLIWGGESTHTVPDCRYVRTCSCCLLAGFPQLGVVTVLAHCVLGSEKRKKKKRIQMVHFKTAPYLAPAPNTSRLVVHFFFSTQNFPCGDVRSVVKRTASGSGLWSSQDVIMRYQRHHMLILTLSFPNKTTVTASKPGFMYVFIYIRVTLMSSWLCIEGGETVSQLVSNTSHIWLLIKGPVRAYSTVLQRNALVL